MRRLFLFLMTAPLWAQTPAPPSYVLATGVSFDAVTRQASTVNTLGVLVGSVKGLPTYHVTTIEMAYVRGQTGMETAPTLRSGMAQTVFQKGYVTLGVCTDLGVSKIGDVATVGTFSGCGYLTWDLGAKVTKDKYHVYLMPSFRMIALNGIQVKPSWSFRLGSGF